MRDTQLYQRILGLEDPWFVAGVELNCAQQRLDIFLEHKPSAVFCCPVCNQPTPLHDHAAERVWRHLDSCQLQTFIHARVPRTGCMIDGCRKVELPWAQTASRFTLLMERLIIDMIPECQNLSGACRIMAIGWDQACGVMRRAVERGQSRKTQTVVEHVGVDEKAFAKGHSHVTIVSGIEQSTVEYVAPDRTAASLAGYFGSRTPERRAGIKAVAMDMWEPYMKATREGLVGADGKIVFDRFHIVRQMNHAVDLVRITENRALGETGCDWLKGTKHWWLYGKENLPDKHRAAFAEVRGLNLKTGRAWAIKETLRELWEYRSPTWARKFFDKWFGWARRSRLKPVKKVAAMLKSHLQGVLNYCEHPITNGVAEGLNSKIMTIKRRCCGFRSIDNSITAIYFHCGGLDLYPL